MNNLVFCACLLLCSGWAFSLESVPELDVSKYIGRWYQIYGGRGSWLGEYGPAAKCIIADYGIYNATTITVKNSNRRNTHDGELNSINGFAYTTEKPGELIVDFSLFPVSSKANYIVVKLGPQTYGSAGLYEFAVVTSPGQSRLYVLARNVDRFFVNFDSEVREFLKESNFSSYLIEPIVIYQSPYCEPIPEPEQ